MLLAIEPLIETRRRAVALLCAMRQDDPGADLSDLVAVVLGCWLNGLGVPAPDVRRHPQGRPASIDALYVLSQKRLVLPRDRRTQALLSACFAQTEAFPPTGDVQFSASAIWHRAVDPLYCAIFRQPDDEGQRAGTEAGMPWHMAG